MSRKARALAELEKLQAMGAPAPHPAFLLFLLGTISFCASLLALLST
ncbi:MAG: hypothetical protein ABF916_09615 [Acetobacter fabarum]